jgi:hypothetical protein
MRVLFGCVGWSVGGSRRGEASGKLPRHPRGFPERFPIVGICSVDRAAHLGQEFSGREGGGTAGVRPPNRGFRHVWERSTNASLAGYSGSSARGGRARDAGRENSLTSPPPPSMGSLCAVDRNATAPVGRSLWANSSADSGATCWSTPSGSGCPQRAARTRVLGPARTATFPGCWSQCAESHRELPGHIPAVAPR